MTVTIKDIFDAMPGRFNAEGAGDWAADIQFRFSSDDGEQPWYLTVHDGECKTGPGEVENPGATISASAETWVGMTTGTVDAMAAFMSGKLKVDGNIGMIMKLQDPNLFRRD